MEDEDGRVECPGCQRRMTSRNLRRHRDLFYNNGVWQRHKLDVSSFPPRLIILGTYQKIVYIGVYQAGRAYPIPQLPEPPSAKSDHPLALPRWRVGLVVRVVYIFVLKGVGRDSKVPKNNSVY